MKQKENERKNGIIAALEDLIQELSLLKHPFYRTWSEGKLTLDALNGYSREYFQLVRAIPTFVETILPKVPKTLRAEIDALRRDEIAHIDPWRKFATALGVSSKTELNNYSGLEKTTKSIRDLSTLMKSSLYSGAAAMFALEKEVPKISDEKIKGLVKFYGINDDDDDALEYLKIHTEIDLEHAETWQKILESAPEEKGEEILAGAEKSLKAQNLLLDACYETYC